MARAAVPATQQGAPIRQWRPLLQYTALAAVAFLVLYPVLLLVASSFVVSPKGAPVSLGLSTWSNALSEPGVRTALWNTLALVLARQSISFVIAIVIAWVIARTDIPGQRWLEFMFLLAFFLPTVPVVEAWVLLLDPDYGIINAALSVLPWVRKPAFDINTFAGIIWVHLAHTAIAVKIVLLVPLFRTMDSSLEEMARMSGGSTLGVLWRISLPILAPGLLIVFLIGSIGTIQSFEIEQILGPPIRFSIFSNEVFRLINRDPPNYAAATSLSSFVLFMMVPLIVAQRWTTNRSQSATVGGRYRNTTIALGRWRRPAFAVILGFALLTAVVPIAILLVFSFARKFGYYQIEHPWTTDNWTRVFTDQTFLASLNNSLQLGVGTAIAGMVGFSLLAYLTVRSRFAWRGTLDVLTWLPSVLPGIILSLALLDFYLGSPIFRPLYGSILGLIIATFISCMTIGVQVIKINLIQLGSELEEAAHVAGASWWQTYRRVILPLTMPSILLCGTLCFALAVRNVSNVVFLGTANTRPLSLLQLDYMTEGWYEPGCVVGLVLAVLTTAVAAIAALYGARFEIAR